MFVDFVLNGEVVDEGTEVVKESLEVLLFYKFGLKFAGDGLERFDEVEVGFDFKDIFGIKSGGLIFNVLY